MRKFPGNMSSRIDAKPTPYPNRMYPRQHSAQRDAKCSLSCSIGRPRIGTRSTHARSMLIRTSAFTFESSTQEASWESSIRPNGILHSYSYARKSIASLGDRGEGEPTGFYGERPNHIVRFWSAAVMVIFWPHHECTRTVTPDVLISMAPAVKISLLHYRVR